MKSDLQNEKNNCVRFLKLMVRGEISGVLVYKEVLLIKYQEPDCWIEKTGIRTVVFKKTNYDVKFQILTDDILKIVHFFK